MGVLSSTYYVGRLVKYTLMQGRLEVMFRSLYLNKIKVEVRGSGFSHRIRGSGPTSGATSEGSSPSRDSTGQICPAGDGYRSLFTYPLAYA